MRRLLLSLICLTGLTNSFAQTPEAEAQRWEDRGFKNVVVDDIDLEPFYQAQPLVTPSFGLKLVSVIFRTSGWSAPEIIARTKDLTETLSQCGVKLTQSKLITVDPIPGFTKFDGQVRLAPDYFDDPNKKEATVSKMLPGSRRPVIFYVQAINTDTAYANLAEAQAPGNMNLPMLDTIWISKAITYSEHKFNPRYSVEAHELGHVLGKLQHIYPPKLPGAKTNLMAADLYKGSPKLEASQCEKILRSELLDRI